MYALLRSGGLEVFPPEHLVQNRPNSTRPSGTPGTTAEPPVKTVNHLQVPPGYLPHPSHEPGEEPSVRIYLYS